MKIYQLIVLLIVSSFFISSCKEEDITDKTPYLFSAILADYQAGTLDSVIMYQYGANTLGKTKIADNGDFSMTILPPERLATINAKSFGLGVVVSDEKAQIGDIILIAGMKAGKITGYIQKSDTSTFYMQTDSTAFEGYTTLLYCDRDFTITGNETASDLVIGDSAIIRYNYAYKYDLDFKKGWNEIIFQANLKIVSDEEVKVDILYNNVSPANFKWRYFDREALNTPQKIKAKNFNILREEILKKSLYLKKL